MDATSPDPMDAVFSALADATRRAMLDRLRDGPGQTLGELTDGLGMRRQSATRHLKVLEGAGLVTIHWRGREKLHYLNPVPIAEVQRRWIDKFSAARTKALADLKHQLEEDS